MIRIPLNIVSHVLFNLVALLSNLVRRVLFGRHPYDYLEITLKGEVSEERAAVGFLSSFTRPRLPLRDFVSLLRLARQDPQLKGVLLRIDGLQAGWAKIQSIRESVERLRQAGKTAIAFLETAGNSEYLLASACDRVFLVPAGSLYLTGLRAEVLMLKEALARLDVEADFESVGRYKGAAESLTRSTLSEAQREAMGSILDDFYDQLVQGIAAGRGRTADEVKTWIDEGPHTAREALKNGLVDRLLYADELDAALEDLEAGTEPTVAAQLELSGPAEARPSNGPAAGAGEPDEPPGAGEDTDAGEDDEEDEESPGSSIRLVDPRHYLLRRRLPTRRVTARPARELIGLVPLTGIIKSGESTGTTPLGRALGSDTAATLLRRARENKRVRAVVLRIDSPGGSGLASDVIWREICLTAAEKPVVASLGDEAASGGYYIAAAAPTILAAPGTLTGSIGVLAGKINLKGLYHRLGARKEVFSRGKRAGLFTDYGGFTEEERAKLREELVAFYDVFVDRVAKGRQRDRDEILQVAEGRVWTGRQAAAHGLVDGLGGLEKAIEVAREKAEIPPDREIGIVMYPRLGHLVRLSLDFSVPGVSLAVLAERWGSPFARLAGLSLADRLPLIGVRLLALAPWRARIR